MLYRESFDQVRSYREVWLVRGHRSTGFRGLGALFGTILFTLPRSSTICAHANFIVPLPAIRTAITRMNIFPSSNFGLAVRGWLCEQWFW